MPKSTKKKKDKKGNQNSSKNEENTKKKSPLSPTQIKNIIDAEAQASAAEILAELNLFQGVSNYNSIKKSLKEKYGIDLKKGVKTDEKNPIDIESIENNNIKQKT